MLINVIALLQLSAPLLDYQSPPSAGTVNGFNRFMFHFLKIAIKAI